MPRCGIDSARRYISACGGVVHPNRDQVIGHEVNGDHFDLLLSHDGLDVGAGRGDGVAILSLFRTLNDEARSIPYDRTIPAEQIEEAARRSPSR